MHGVSLMLILFFVVLLSERDTLFFSGMKYFSRFESNLFLLYTYKFMMYHEENIH